MSNIQKYNKFVMKLIETIVKDDKVLIIYFRVFVKL